MNDRERWVDATQAMQSGVAIEMIYRQEPTEPKHLRVGINVALAEHGSLVSLLIKKGIITEAEYLAAIADGMEAEKERYEEHLNELTGTKITLK